MAPVLIVGATRGLGASLVKQYAAKEGTTVYGTSRSQGTPKGFPESVKWVGEIDLMEPSVGDNLVKQLEGLEPFSAVVSVSSQGTLVHHSQLGSSHGSLDNHGWSLHY
jgi:NAD(P)-dependent dehydrogenase (short-subunit alcohol dehydrogenase family)